MPITQKLRRSTRLLVLLFVPMSMWGQAGQENFTGCAKCHIEGRTQPATDMAQALQSADQARLFIERPLLTATDGKYSYRVERKGDHSFYSVTDGSATITMPIRWAVGASSALGQTFLLENDGKLYESRMSWFKELNALAPTLGGRYAHPADLGEAAGRSMSQGETQRCLGCHATNAAAGGQLTPDKMIPGVQCGHCHEAAEAHMAAQIESKSTVAAGLGALHDFKAENVSNFCGRCHRTWAEVLVEDDRSLNNVRFQPYRLWGSKCYDPDDTRISCVACHNPHKNPSAQMADYDPKCLACHGGAKVEAKACKVAKNNCVSCHMPRVDLPGAHYKFIDHRIRVVRANEPYPR